MINKQQAIAAMKAVMELHAAEINGLEQTKTVASYIFHLPPNGEPELNKFVFISALWKKCSELYPKDIFCMVKDGIYCATRKELRHVESVYKRIENGTDVLTIQEG